MLRNNRACCPHGVATRSQHFCGKGALRELARDSAVKNWRVSDDQRPPTSPLKTKRRHLPSSPDSSGYVRTLSFIASTSLAPSLVVALALAVPSLLRALTRVASVARCAIPNIARPSATTSSRQLVEILQIHVATMLAPRAITFSIARRRVDGHTCSSVVTRKTAEQHNSERPSLNGKQLVRGATGERDRRQRAFFL